MYEITAEARILGDVEQVWAVATDVNGRPSWDPHEEEARLDGPFVAGSVGWSKPHGGPATDWTITEVVQGSRWGSECPLPGGRITGVNTYEQVADGVVLCTKTVRVHGPLTVLFRLYFGRRMREDMFRTFAALEAEAARRVAA